MLGCEKKLQTELSYFEEETILEEGLEKKREKLDR